MYLVINLSHILLNFSIKLFLIKTYICHKIYVKIPMPTIALVDDEISIRTSVSLALESDGFQVDAFNNGVEALEALENKHYDLGLFDIKMPKMDGNELLSRVRNSKSEILKNMPVIFLTSKDQEQDEIIGLRMGAADYITKPFSQKLLNERIRTVLRVWYGI